MPLTDGEKRRMAKAIWAYSGLDQREFAEAAGMSYDRLRAAMNDEAKSPPSTDELLAMAAAAGVPREVALDGWMGGSGDLADIRAQITEIAIGLAVTTQDTAKNTQAIQEILARGRRPGRSGEAP